MSQKYARVAPVLLLGAASLLLAACGSDSLARNFGFVRDAPDEFTVTTQAPLSMPPDYTLRPPRPGAPRPQDRSERLAAEEALDPQLALLSPGAVSGAAAPVSPGQQALIAEAGPPAPANVRGQVDRQAAAAQPSQSFIDRLMFWRGPRQPGEVVDARKESERLRKDAALGESPVAGATPIIQNKPKGLLEGLL